jgi:hypothetical protein
VAASVLGSFAWRKKMRADAQEGARARAAVRTSRLALALPVVSFLIVTVLIWAAVLSGTREFLPKGESIFSEALLDDPTPHWTIGALDPPASLALASKDFQESPVPESAPLHNNYALRVFAWTMGSHLPFLLLLVTLTSFLLLWWVLPSVLTEAMVPREVTKPPRDTSDKDSVRMGTWMSRGLDATTFVTLLLWSAIFVIPAAYKVAAYEWPSFGLRMSVITFHIVTNTFIGFALLAALAQRGRTVLATILDVDTYLRTTPTDGTPRALIFERYVSTLRYLRLFRDESGHGYDSIVILAHSLGALISGDVLYYLQSDKGAEEWCPSRRSTPKLAPKFTAIPIALITVGNPVRQLLNRFFPYLYDWVRPVPDNGADPLPEPLPLPKPGAEFKIDDTLPPDPADLGLTCWINAFRSGDYVGRSLWLGEWYHRPSYLAGNPDPLLVHSDSCMRQEMCIGAGAHVHYMDDTAPDIAWLLDSLL